MKNKKNIEISKSAIENLWRVMYDEDEIPFSVRYFILKYNRFPNYINFAFPVYINKVLGKLLENYKESNELISHFKKYKPEHEKGKKTASTYLYKLKEGLIIDFDSDQVEIAYDNSFSKREIIRLKKLMELYQIPQIPEPKKFYMVKKGDLGFDIDSFDIRKTEVILEENYNDELMNLNEKLVSFINSNDTNGMLLLHGIPGTGKTTYLRHLITVCNARFIYLPNNLFCHLSDPDFFTFILGYKNSVIILEDCEELLKPRDQNGNTVGISTLLNLSDGLLGDAMRLKIICTFNTEIRNIDQALLRKGRLAYKYEFSALSVTKTNKLLNKLNVDLQPKEGMILSEIYNYSHDNGKMEEAGKYKIGF